MFLNQLAYAVRALRRNPAFALTAVITLALGIGATTAIFSVANAVLLRSLPYPDADRLALVWSELRARDLRDFPLAPGDFPELKAQATAFEDLAAVIPGRQPLSGDNEAPEQVPVAVVTPNLMTMLGAKVLVGRLFSAEDALPQPQPPAGAPAQPGAAGPPPLPQMVLLSHSLWIRRYGGDTSIVGKRIDLGFGGAQVVGVLAPGFQLLWPVNTGVEIAPDVFSAARINFANASRINVSLRVLGKLKPGVPLSAAQAQLDHIAEDLRKQFPIKATANMQLYAKPMHADLVEEVRPAITILMGAVAFVLLIACANVANLLLVRNASRERELAVRSAMGASPSNIALPLFAEVAVIAFGGALLGLALAYGGTRLLVALAPPTLPRVADVTIDPLVLAFTMLVTVVAAFVFGMVPVLRSTRPNVTDALRAGGKGGIGAGRRLRQAVVISEVALAFVLLVGGGLMMRTFAALQHTAPGFDPRGVLTFQTALQSPNEQARAAFFSQLGERLRALPGVTGASAGTPTPLNGETVNARWGTEAAATDPASFRQANVRIVLPGFFEVMHTRLLDGRAFTDADNNTNTKAIIIDRILAEKAFPGQSAVGKQLLVRVRTQEPELLQVIGVVDHQRHETLASDGRETIYVTDAFFGFGAAGEWVVRTTCEPNGQCNPSRIAPEVRRIVAELDARTPISRMQPLQDLVDRSMASTRFTLALTAIFAGIAALLACVGLYGVLATTVRQRTTELGVRLALGAPRSSVFRLVVGEGMRMTIIGIGIGLVAAFMLTRVMQGMLVGVKPTDPLTFAGVVLLFLVVAAVATWMPARRAAGLDPMQALRSE